MQAQSKDLAGSSLELNQLTPRLLQDPCWTAQRRRTRPFGRSASSSPCDRSRRSSECVPQQSTGFAAGENLRTIAFDTQSESTSPR